jgi:hypothetical protein
MAKKVITSNLTKLSAAHQRNAKRLPGAIEAGFAEIAAESIGLYQKTTRTWKHQPRFYSKRTARGVTINTDSDIYKWTDFGTRPHIIKAKNAPFLVFRWPYKAATKPRVIGSTKATVGKNWARKLLVHHPGTKPRHFTDEISTRMQKRAANIMRKHLKAAINVEAVGL